MRFGLAARARRGFLPYPRMREFMGSPPWPVPHPLGLTESTSLSLIANISTPILRRDRRNSNFPFPGTVRYSPEPDDKSMAKGKHGGGAGLGILIVAMAAIYCITSVGVLTGVSLFCVGARDQNRGLWIAGASNRPTPSVDSPALKAWPPPWSRRSSTWSPRSRVRTPSSPPPLSPALIVSFCGDEMRSVTLPGMIVPSVFLIATLTGCGVGYGPGIPA